MNIFITTFRLVLAFVCGSVIGLEREIKRGPAGLRTHILVCMGATLIMLVSIYIYDQYKGVATVDPGRIAAGVVTGVGFLGAGTIMRSSERVRGLTTAASIWISAAIGLAIGCGYISGALIVTVITFFALSVLKKIEDVQRKKKND